MVRVKLPYHLQNLARVGAEIEIEVNGEVTPRAILDALEARYPMLRGTIPHLRQRSWVFFGARLM